MKYRSFIVSCIAIIAFSLGALSGLAAGGTEEAAEIDPADWDRPEAPELAALVDAGELPPLEERLPTNPKVVEPHERIGVYGGEGRSALIGPEDAGWLSRSIAVDGLLHWDPDYSQPVAAAAASYEMSDDARAVTIELREGLRWHDGEPFTTEDVEWWYENELQKESLNPVLPSTFTHEDELVQLEIVDEQVFRFSFTEPNPLFVDELASTSPWYPTARHYAEQFHADFNDDIHELAEAEGFDDWADYYDYLILDGTAPYRNPDLPTIRAWTVEEGEGYTGDATRVRFKRNPYYYRVDTEGNQLPYIDSWVFAMIEDDEVLLLQTIAGEIDIMQRHIQTAENRPVLADNAERGGYRLYEQEAVRPGVGIMSLNMTVEDEVYRELFRNRDFRAGLSHAIDREEINDLVFAGLAVPGQSAPLESMPWYNEQLATQHIEHDPDLAKEYFERAGLEQDSDGRWLDYEGDPIVIPFDISTHAAVGVGEAEIIAEQWDRVGIELELNAIDRSLWATRQWSNQSYATLQHAGAGAARDVLLRPDFFLPWSTNSRFGFAWAAWAGDETILEHGTEPEEPPEPMRRQIELFREARRSAPERQEELMTEIMEIAAEQFPNITLFSSEPDYGIISVRIVNGPPDEGSLQSHPLGDAGVYHWSQWFFDEASD